MIYKKLVFNIEKFAFYVMLVLFAFYLKFADLENFKSPRNMSVTGLRVSLF